MPYLDGGIFLPHEIETAHADIAIPDSAFEELFAFFDEYKWHLDERPNRDDKEINPDVLGFIFEKYINQKEMGAYYTKEDITEYIGRSTIVPRLFDMAAEKCAVAFEEGGPVWSLLSADPDRYIFEPVRRGVVLADGSVLPESALPDFVQIGMHDPKARMFERRYNLGDAQLHDADGSKLTLPTETWREYVERRKRCLELREKLRNGEVHEVNDLITYNLDLRQLAEDAVGRCGPDLLMAFWRALTTITVLDPTVGSGAFLFAALNILYPLYEACLDQMEALVADADRQASPLPMASGLSPLPYPEFRTILARMAEHPNRRYYILKTIIVNNLFGVDIMQEAVEICKLRLFLKLAAQVDRVEQIEPLPDIDFNIRCGNTLVGYARIEDIDRLWDEIEKDQLPLFGDHSKLEGMVREYAIMLDYFRRTQLGLPTPQPIGKADLQHARGVILPELDNDLQRLYRAAGKLADRVTRDEFVRTHQPFHWFLEFPQAMAAGGFDVVIGNPPYVEMREVREYRLVGYSCEPCGSLYAVVVERCLSIVREGGLTSMIVQLPIVCTDRMKPLRLALLGASTHAFYANFDDRPGRLFDGLEHIRATIFVIRAGSLAECRVYATKYVRWYSEFRAEMDALFGTLEYSNVTELVSPATIPKVGSALGRSALYRLGARACIRQRSVTGGPRQEVLYHNAPQYWVRATTFFPFFSSERGRSAVSAQLKSIAACGVRQRVALTALLNSSLFYWWFIIRSDCRHLNAREIDAMPAHVDAFNDKTTQDLEVLVDLLMEDYRARSRRKVCEYKATGRVEYDEFYPGLSKPIIDEIDQVLAKHYGFTDEELDFIINYDIKYRMGKDAGEE